MQAHTVTTPDGRDLEVVEAGDPQGRPWLYHGGSPSAAVIYPPFAEAASARGLRLITYSRPGYGASTPRRAEQGAPRVVDDVADAVVVLDALGVGEFVTLGWSGGGPRALACATLLPDRCRAATSLAGIAPYDGEGLAWTAGMAPENVAEYTAAAEGSETYDAYLTADFLPVLQAGPEDFSAGMGELLTPVDRAALDPGYTAWLVDLFRAAGAQGVVGVRDDGLAGVSPWGLDLSTLTVPTAVWQGDQDAMVPFAHGQWLAAHVPGTRAHLEPGEGHLSLLARLDDLLDELLELAGWA